MDVKRWGFLFAFLACSPAWLQAQTLVPGTGERVLKVGDDFEDPQWAYTYNLPKSSDENDKQQRLPAGASVNGRWYEGVMRGQPDLIKRILTPEGGIEGSMGALLLRSRNTGVPGRYSHTMQQDDLIVDVSSRIGAIPVSWSPSVVVRVFFPPFEQWEQRTGPSFAFRASCQTHKTERKFFGSQTSLEPYWPGFFVQFTKGQTKEKDSAAFSLRAGPNGGDFMGPKITELGWWTLGMSFTPDGRVHYYAHPGVEDLTSKDYIASQYPYSYRCEQLETFFFNVVSGDNGNWSTPWIVDDAELYLAR